MRTNSLANKKVLITCGPTWVSIDTMRVISNQSTGAMGQQIAKDFTRQGAGVTLLEGPVANPLHSKTIRVLKFQFFDDFTAILKKELQKKYDICIHAAAVSDYKIRKPFKTKLGSGQKILSLELVATPKIINQIKRINPSLTLVGFKLESKMNKTTAVRESRKLFEQARCNYVVANSFQNGNYSGYILDKDLKFLSHQKSRLKLSQSLIGIIKEEL